MKINHHNPNSMFNTQGLEQASRQAAKAKAEEAAKARAAAESLKLQKEADALKEKGIERPGDQRSKQKKGRRNASYRPDGSVEPPDDEQPTDSSLPSSKGIDLKA